MQLNLMEIVWCSYSPHLHELYACFKQCMEKEKSTQILLPKGIFLKPPHLPWIFYYPYFEKLFLS